MKLYVNGAVPPVTAPMVTDPVVPPQLVFTGVSTTAVGGETVPTVTFVVKIHPLLSLTDAVYVPGAKPVYEVVPVKGLPFTE